MTDRTVVYRLQAEATQFKAQMAAAGASVKKAADDMTGASKRSEEFRKGLDTVGVTAGKVALVAAAGLGAVLVKTANFEQAMSNVQAATHETAAGMEDLRQAALDAGASTVFSATEAAGAIENLAKAGLSTEDILGGGLAGALDLAAAGGMEVAAAAEAAAGAMAQFKLDGDQATHVADLLAAGAGKAQGDVSDMVMALKQAGTVSAQTGLSIEETTGSLAAMAEQSLLGSDAGTSFKTMLAALTPNSTAAANAMEKYNIHAFDAQGNFVGMTALAGQLKAGLGNLTDEQRAMTLETIFGSDAVRAASIIYDNGAAGIQGWIDKTNDAGYAAETAEIKLDNLKGDVEALGGAFETALIGTGSSSQGPLRSLTQGLTDAVNAYNDLGEGAKSGVAVALTATVAMGGGLFVFSKMVQSIAATRVAMEQLGISATGTKGSLAAVGRTVIPLVAVAGAVTALGNAIAEANGAALNSSDLQRNIEALSLGNGDATLDRVISDLEIVNQLSGDLSEPVKEVVTLFGVFGNTNLDNAKDNLAQMDDALAGLVETGNADKAAEVFERIMKASDLDDAEVTEYFDSYQTALENADAAGADATTTTESMTAATTDLGAAASQSAAQVEAQAEALQDAREAAHDTATQFFNLGDALNDGKVSLGEWITQMANQADALNNFTSNAEKAADRGLRKGLIAALKDAGPEGALRMKQLANASESEIGRANASWAKGQRAIDDYVAATVKVPKKVSTDVDVNALPAFASFRQVDQWMSDLDGRRATTYIDTVRTMTDRRGGAAFSQKATGGLILGPGTGTSDEVPIWASNKEYIVKAAAVQKYGVHMFDSLNAMRYAGGGQVGGKGPQAVARPEGGLAEWLKAQERLAEKMAKAADKGLDAAEKNLDAAQGLLDSAQSLLDTTQAQRDSFASQVAGNFDNDIFGNGLAGAMLQLNADTNDASGFEDLIRSLSGSGLDGAAFQALAASGDMNTAQQLAVGGAGSIDAFEAAYAARASAQASLSGFAADTQFATTLAAQTAEVQKQTAAVQAQTVATQQQATVVRQLDQRLQMLEGAVERGAEKGTRAGNNDRNQDTKVREKAGR